MMTELDKINRELRKQIVRLHANSKTSHIASSLSAVDIIAVLYNRILKVDPKNPFLKDRDRFILSKGHAAPALYVVLNQLGFFTGDPLANYGAEGTELFEHPETFSATGIDVSTGSLGHGLSVGAGIAFAGKLDRMDYKVFVLMSDGECQEGAIWEAAMMASSLNLDNLTSIVDYNNLQGYGKTDNIQGYEKIIGRFRNSGWAVLEVDGHNLSQLQAAFSSLPKEEGKPTLIIAHTVKGKGIPEIENKLEWHYKSPDPTQAEQFIREIDRS